MKSYFLEVGKLLSFLDSNKKKSAKRIPREEGKKVEEQKRGKNVKKKNREGKNQKSIILPRLSHRTKK